MSEASKNKKFVQLVKKFYDRAVADLVLSHSKFEHSPLILVVELPSKNPLDVTLFEVIEDFPGKLDAPLYETKYGPHAHFHILGSLYLVLASPEQLEHALKMERKKEQALIRALKQGTVRFEAKKPKARAALARMAKISLGL